MSTLRGENGEFVERSPAASSDGKSGLAVPAPVPAQSSKWGVPSRLQPPKPKGDTGSTRVSEAAP